MKIKFNCGMCGKLIVADEPFAGKRAKCPDCKVPLVVPIKSTATSSTTVKAQTAETATKKTALPDAPSSHHEKNKILDKTTPPAKHGEQKKAPPTFQNLASPEEKLKASSFSSSIFHTIVATKPQKMSTRVKTITTSGRMQTGSSRILASDDLQEEIAEDDLRYLLVIKKKIYLLATCNVMLVIVALITLF